MLSFLRMSVEEVSAVVMAGPLGAISQELLLLGFFYLSYTAWRCLGRYSKKVRAAKKLAPVSYGPQKSPSVTRTSVKPSVEQEKASKDRHSPRTCADASVKAAEAKMLQHLEKLEFTRAINMYRSLERDGRERRFSEAFYLSFFQSAVRVGKMDVMENILRDMKRSGLVPSVCFWQSLLRMLSSRKQYSACLAIHAAYSAQLPADKIVFSCLVNAALEIGHLESASSMLQQYSEADIDVSDHILFFRVYAAMGNVDAAEGLFRKLGGKTTTLMLNLLLLTCVHAGQSNKAWELLREARALEQNLAVDSKIVDVVSYNTVIKGLAQAGPPARCFECLHAMMEQGIQPDNITFSTLLDAGIGGNNVDMVGEVTRLFMESNRPIGTVMGTLLIKGLVKANCLPKALELCKEMRQRSGDGPDVIMYSVLIKALVDEHDLEQALSLVGDMKSAGLKPDDIILTHLLEGCRYTGNHAFGQELFTSMLDSGVKPSDFTLVAMLKLHGRYGAHREAHELVAGWEAKHGFKPSVVHYTCLMSGCMRSKKYDLAWAAYEMMRSKGVSGDGTTLSTLLPGMVAAQYWDKVVILVRQALAISSSHKVPGEVLNHAVSQMQSSASHKRHAEQLQDLMKAAGVPVKTRRFRRSVAHEAGFN